MKWDDLSEQVQRNLLFTPCDSKEGLGLWIRRFLGLDLPDTLVDPASTSTPLSLTWEIYNKALKNDDPEFSRILGYASREGGKTLVSAIIEVLALIHLDRSVVHMASILQQSWKTQSYMETFFQRPLLRDHVVLNNSKKKVIGRYVNRKTKDIITPKQFDALSVKDDYECIENEIIIIAATMQAVNGQHSALFIAEELDVIQNPRVYEEAKLIPSPFKGKNPITILTSTRKFSYGLVQKEIDEAERTGLNIRFWNILECTAPCPKERHLPDKPMVDAYIDNDTLVQIGKGPYDSLSSDQQKKYEHVKAFEGCLSRCKILAACKTRLATHQKPGISNSKVSTLLKPVTHTQNQFTGASVEMALSQLLCRKPSTTGLIYPGLDRTLHSLTPAQIMELVTGDKYPADMTKPQLVVALKARETKFFGGMDFGYTHCWSFVIGFVDGPRCFILEAISQAELEIEQQIEISKARVGHYQASIYADPENPQAILSFRRNGFRIQKVEKGPGSVISGIELLRSKLRPAVGQPKVYFLKDPADTGIDLLIKHLSAYHWKLDAAGELSDIPDEKDDDLPDACRYLIMGVFGKQGKVVASKGPDLLPQENPVYNAKDWMKKAISERVNDPESPATSPDVRGKKGRIRWDLG